jgi:hypothetical protein
MILYTDAPECYDGFGTRTLESHAGTYGGKRVRKVEVEAQALGWQQGRYGSGLYLAAPLEQWRELIAAGLAVETTRRA